MQRISLAAVAVLAAASMSQTAAAQSAEQRLGKVHFATSCNAQAQTVFDRAMLYQHSFWYSASRRTFEEVLRADPECGIATRCCSGISTRQSNANSLRASAFVPGGNSMVVRTQPPRPIP